MAKDERTGDKVAIAVKVVKSIEELPGVGPATAEKLREAGFTDLMGLAVASPQMIADAAELGTNVAQKIIIAAREAVDIGGFETGDVILERRKSVAKLTTCSKALMNCWAAVSRRRRSPRRMVNLARERANSAISSRST